SAPMCRPPTARRRGARRSSPRSHYADRSPPTAAGLPRDPRGAQPSGSALGEGDADLEPAARSGPRRHSGAVRVGDRLDAACSSSSCWWDGPRSRPSPPTAASTSSCGGSTGASRRPSPMTGRPARRRTRAHPRTLRPAGSEQARARPRARHRPACRTPATRHRAAPASFSGCRRRPEHAERPGPAAGRDRRFRAYPVDDTRKGGTVEAEPRNAAHGAAPVTSAIPAVVDRARWQAEVDALRAREKAHTREGDAIAAARRRLPMVEVDADAVLVGPDGPVALRDVFEGRRQLIAYYHMWYPGRPASEQCEGCTLYSIQVRELSYLHSRDVTYATFCQGPYDESARYREFLGLDMPWYSVLDAAESLLAGRRFNRFYLVCYLRQGGDVFETYWTNGRGVEAMAPGYASLLDRTVYGRQEAWEDSPPGWPQPWHAGTNPYRCDE